MSDDTKPGLGIFKQPRHDGDAKWDGETKRVWVPALTPKELEARKRQHERREQLRAFRDAGISEEVLRTWDTDDEAPVLYTRPVFEVFRSMVSAHERLLTLSGEAGCGKTYAAFCAVRLRVLQPLRHFRALAEGTKPPVVIEQAMLYRAEPWAAEPWDTWRDSSLIVLEDLGTEALDPQGHMLAKIDRLVNERYADNRRLIITTNLSLKLFGPRYGERVLSRLMQPGLSRFVEIPQGRSLRT